MSRLMTTLICDECPPLVLVTNSKLVLPPGSREGVVGKGAKLTLNPNLRSKKMIKNFLRDETGLELSEYAVAAALIALAVVGVFTVLGTNIGSVISNLATKIK
jgi:pilus assembly protein Flp/PilA